MSPIRTRDVLVVGSLGVVFELVDITVLINPSIVVLRMGRTVTPAVRVGFREKLELLAQHSPKLTRRRVRVMQHQLDTTVVLPFRVVIGINPFVSREVVEDPRLGMGAERSPGGAAVIRFGEEVEVGKVQHLLPFQILLVQLPDGDDLVAFSTDQASLFGIERPAVDELEDVTGNSQGETQLVVANLHGRPIPLRNELVHHFGDERHEGPGVGDLGKETLHDLLERHGLGLGLGDVFADVVEDGPEGGTGVGIYIGRPGHDDAAVVLIHTLVVRPGAVVHLVVGVHCTGDVGVGVKGAWVVEAASLLGHRRALGRGRRGRRGPRRPCRRRPGPALSPLFAETVRLGALMTLDPVGDAGQGPKGGLQIVGSDTDVVFQGVILAWHRGTAGLDVDGSDVESPEGGKLLFSLLRIHQADVWGGRHPEQTVNVRTATSLPLVPEPVGRELELFGEILVEEALEPVVKVVRSDLGVVSEVVASDPLLAGVVGLEPLVVARHDFGERVPVQVGRGEGEKDAGRAESIAHGIKLPALPFPERPEIGRASCRERVSR